jgi:cobalt-zinc-cadmium efflux system outer membrane protein
MVLPVFLCIVLAAATGCAYKPVERFPDIQRSIVERLGSRVVWDRDDSAGAAVRSEVAALLARPLTADAAVQIALLNSNSLQATFEDLGIAQADLVQAGLLRNPSIAGFLRWFNVSPAGGPNWNLGIDFPLLDPFLVPLRKKLAGFAADEAVDRVAGAVLRQAADTRVAFYALQADQQVVESRRVMAELASVAAALAERQYQAGNIDDLAFAGQRAAHQQAKIALIQAESATSVSRERLRRLLGLSNSAASWTTEVQSLPPESAFDQAELVARAVSTRFDVDTARKDLERQAYALELTRAWWLESVQVGVETERASGGGYQTGPHISLDIPIFDQKQAAMARQEAIIRQSRRRLADIQDQARQEVITALERMNAAARIARYYDSDVVPLRQQMSAMTEKRHQGMLVGVFELLNAKSEETDAVIATVRARQDYWNAQSDLEFALGGRLPPPDHAIPRPATGTAPVQTPKPPATQPVQTMPAMPGM